jgi:CheY-like chemotaxis protein
MGEDLRLRGRRVLVVEDEFFIADDLARDFAAMGAEIVGPVGTIDQAMRLLHDELCIDGAVVDIKLGAMMAFPIADELLARNVPVVFATGYDADVLPRRFVGVPRYLKPTRSEQVAAALAKALDRTPSGTRPKRRPPRRPMAASVLTRRRRIAPKS